MRTSWKRFLALALALVVLPLPTLAQEGTPGPVPDLGTAEGQQALADAQRRLTAEDVGLPAGYTIDLVVGGVDAPIGLAVGPDGALYAAPSGLLGGPPEIVRVDADGTTTVVASEGLGAPITDIEFGPDGRLYVSFAGTIAAVDPTTGAVAPLITDLPAFGNHPNTQLAFGPDGWVYFGLGLSSNAGVVGLDNAWLEQRPDIFDVPCDDIVVASPPYVSANPFTEDPDDLTATSPYQPFGQVVQVGTTFPAQTKCNGALFRVQPADPERSLEVFVWGFLSAFGVAVDPTGAVWVTDDGPDNKGSRLAVRNAPETLWRFEEGDAGRWTGLPDYVAGLPVTDPRYATSGDPRALEFIFANHDELLKGREPATPFTAWEPHTGNGHLALAPASWGELQGHFFAGHFGTLYQPGEEGAGELPGPAGSVDHVDPTTGQIVDFLANPDPGPAGGAPERPMGLAFGADGALYIADLGVLPYPGTGAIWRVTPPSAADAAATPAA